MSGKKRKTVDYDWVDENIISRIPTECMEKVKPLQESVNQWKQNKESMSFPSLPAGSLNPEDVVAIFNLRLQRGVEFEFADEDILEVPTELESTFAKYQSVLGLSSASNEALARSFVNLVIFNCILEERMIINNTTRKPRPQPTSSSTSFVTPPKSIAESPASTAGQDICVYFETEIRQAISFKGKDYVLSGIADCSLGYNDAGTGSGNLVVVEAKRRYYLPRAYGQLLAYMGMIHTARKAEGKDNSIIYGVATDGFEYRFWRIENNSNISSSGVYDWNKKSQRKLIYSMFRSIIRAAILTTPTTPPVKRKELGEHFQCVDHPKLDFAALSLWQDIFITEDYSDADIIEMAEEADEGDTIHEESDF